MSRNLMILFSGVILTFALVLAGSVEVKRGPSLIPEAETFEIMASGDAKAECTLYKHNNSGISYYSWYSDGDQTVTYFNPVDCGVDPTFPFDITSFTFMLYFMHTWPTTVTVDIVVYDMADPGDSCAGPGDELFRHTVTCDSATYAWPNTGTVNFTLPCRVYRPFYMGIQYNHPGLSQYASVVFDNQDPDTCDNWIDTIGVLWEEWYDFDATPPGYPMFWVHGTNSLNWFFHFRGYDQADVPGGVLRVWGTQDCDTTGGLVYIGYANTCTVYSGKVPEWANDIMMSFEWQYICGNVDWIKFAAPSYEGGQWQLRLISEFVWANIAGKGRGSNMFFPSIGDPTGDIQMVYTMVNLEEWLAGTPVFQDDYTITNGECDELPGYMIGTTPITFNPQAGPEENPFSTEPLTGSLIRDGETGFMIEPEECDCIPGDADGNGNHNLLDVTHIINYLYKYGPPPTPYSLCSGDADCDCSLNILDVTYIINYLYKEGPAPCSCLLWQANCGPPLRK